MEGLGGGAGIQTRLRLGMLPTPLGLTDTDSTTAGGGTPTPVGLLEGTAALGANQFEHKHGWLPSLFRLGWQGNSLPVRSQVVAHWGACP